MNRLVGLIFSLLLLQCYGTAQIDYQFTSNRDTALIGDPVELQMVLQVTPELQLKEADLNPLESAIFFNDASNKEQTISVSNGDYEILDYGNWKDIDKKEGRIKLSGPGASSGGTYTNTLVVTFWQEGNFRLTGPTIMLANKNQIIKAIPDKPIRLLVRAPALDSILQEGLAPIKPIIKEPVKWIDYLPAILFLAGLILVGLVWYVFNRRKTREDQKEVVETVEVAVHEIALKKLESLDSQQLVKNWEYKLYHDELTFILREYLENRFGIYALELTTKDILKQVRTQQVLTSRQQELKKLLEKADLVKFAESEPPPEFHKDAMVLVKEFVMETSDESVSKTFTKSQFEAFFGKQK